MDERKENTPSRRRKVITGLVPETALPDVDSVATPAPFEESLTLEHRIDVPLGFDPDHEYWFRTA